MKKIYESSARSDTLLAMAAGAFGLSIWIFSAALADAPFDNPAKHIEGANTKATFQNAQDWC